MTEFIQVFGQRFIGLIDNQGVYNTYRVPNPEAPYPQDYIIDQQGYVCYWSDEYDPQEIIRVIDELLAQEVEEQEPETITPDKLKLNITPNPAKELINIKFQTYPKNKTTLRIYNGSGQLIKDFSLSATNGQLPAIIKWSGTDRFGRSVPAGVYFVTLTVNGQVITKTVVLTK